jgi:hypothetical protein
MVIPMFGALIFPISFYSFSPQLYLSQAVSMSQALLSDGNRSELSIYLTLSEFQEARVAVQMLWDDNYKDLAIATEADFVET